MTAKLTGWFLTVVAVQIPTIDTDGWVGIVGVTGGIGTTVTGVTGVVGFVPKLNFLVKVTRTLFLVSLNTIMFPTVEKVAALVNAVLT